MERQLLIALLIQTYPISADMLVAEARLDIPPLYRGIVWACALGVKVSDREVAGWAMSHKAILLDILYW